LDGFGTGEGQSLAAPFGHAGTRLHEWFFPTRTFRAMQGQPGGSTGIDDAFASAWAAGIGAEIMGRGQFRPQHDPRPVRRPGGRLARGAELPGRSWALVVDEIRLSKLLSLVLRHDPRRVGIALDSAGWVPVGDLVDALNRSGFTVSRAQVE